ncbi:MAG: hypothetical protein V3R25_10135 [Nitrosomonadaceae bacterium]
MPTVCTRCQGTGFLNNDQLPESVTSTDSVEEIAKWCMDNEGHDVEICDCCADGENWHGIAGEHYNHEDPSGKDGPYEYNGGLCECH